MVREAGMTGARWFTAGAVAMAAVAGFTVIVYAGGSATQPPAAMERRAALWMRSITIPAEVKSRVNPVADSAEVQAGARAHWADHCSVCHANDGSGNTEMGRHMFPPAPDMRQTETQSLGDGELFYIIENGVRLTGMPGWGGPGRDDKDSWKLVRFIRHLPSITAEELAEMATLNPKTPDELEEEKEERDFLNGANSDGKTQPEGTHKHPHH
jgi:mono/diheme cytochrome c family protein